MTELLTLLGLLTLTYLASFLLSAKQRQGYGLISGAEFLAVGFAVGPTGLAFLSGEVIERAAPAIMLATGWLGLRLGLRFLPSELSALSGEHRVAILIKPLVALGALVGLITLLERLGGPRFTWPDRLALAAVGSVTTRSAILSLTALHQADGPVSRLLRSIARFDDLPAVLVMGALFAWRAAPGVWGLAAGASLLGGLVLGGVASLLLGRGAWREDFAWVAMLGFTALLTGLSAQVGVSSLAVAVAFGLAICWASPHAGLIAEMTQQTERPIMQVLLLLIGAQLTLAWEQMGLALVFLLLRAGAKLAAGLALWALRLPSTRGEPLLGQGLLPCGGMATVMVLSYVQPVQAESSQLLLWSFVVFCVFGDLLGSRALKGLLIRRGELGAGAAVPSSEPLRLKVAE